MKKTKVKLVAEVAPPRNPPPVDIEPIFEMIKYLNVLCRLVDAGNVDAIRASARFVRITSYGQVLGILMELEKRDWNRPPMERP